MRLIQIGGGLAFAIFVAGCPSAPLVCAAGTHPAGDVCLPDATDSGVLDANTARDVGPAPDGAADASDAARVDACVPASSPDLPDDDGLDTNCDGIDGDAAASVFVSESSGLPGAAGTREEPVASITEGIALASTSSRSIVLVQGGSYDEAVELTEGVSIYGGYDASWSRVPDHAIVMHDGPVLSATDIADATVVSRVDFHAADALGAGDSSIAAFVLRSDGVQLVDVELVAGRGGDGADGTRPGPGGAGGMGGLGHVGVIMGSCLAGAGAVEPDVGTGAAPVCGCGAGGDGGEAGGRSVSGSFRAPTAGAVGVRPGGGMDCFTVMGGGGMGGAAGMGGANGGRGADGTDGTGGAGGTGALPIGMFSETGFAPADGGTGVYGGSGYGGGGGGGGFSGCVYAEFCRRTGGTGGGGGSGACGGAGGEGGGGGGASIALYLWESHPVLVRVTVRAGDGGSGGDGSLGGLGGVGGLGEAGGLGMPGACDVGAVANGGRGGDGGDGGLGGGGGGGTGGPSIGILLGAGSTQGAGSSGASVLPGAGGLRGLGGGSAATGENGLVQPTYTPA